MTVVSPGRGDRQFGLVAAQRTWIVANPSFPSFRIVAEQLCSEMARKRQTAPLATVVPLMKTCSLASPLRSGAPRDPAPEGRRHRAWGQSLGGAATPGTQRPISPSPSGATGGRNRKQRGPAAHSPSVGRLADATE